MSCAARLLASKPITKSGTAPIHLDETALCIVLVAELGQSGYTITISTTVDEICMIEMQKKIKLQASRIRTPVFARSWLPFLIALTRVDEYVSKIALKRLPVLRLPSLQYKLQLPQCR
jgi:hypothetical protein